MDDDGTLCLTLTAALSGAMTVDETAGATLVDEEARTDVMLFSTDGVSWSQPIAVPGYRTTPMSLGSGRIMLRGWTSKIDVPETFALWFSDDRTWNSAFEPALTQFGLMLTANLQSIAHRESDRGRD